LPAGGGFDAMVDHAAHVERSRRALERDLAAEAALVKRMAEIEARIARVRADKVPLEVQREALLRARQALQEADERRAAFARAFETSGRPDSVAIYGADMGPAQDAQGGFRALRGRLSFPIAGRAEVQHETRSGGPGIAFITTPFTGVRSVAAGRVAFADRQDEYGLTVIIDHGDRYFTLYSSLGRLDVRAGDSVAAGARLGTAGSTDGSPAQLYFEIRRNGATLDPGPWLGL
jgi:septal ring factor EnvC (AmiA/AmiB activator)